MTCEGKVTETITLDKQHMVSRVQLSFYILEGVQSKKPFANKNASLQHKEMFKRLW